MIEEIRIENIGVISSARLELAPSLTAITGETGAGKTMVLTSLGLLLGGRADPAMVRAGAGRAVVEGVVAGPSSAVRERATEAGAELDDDALLIVRTVPAEGRSRAFLGGRAVPQAVLAEVAADLVTVHGQTDQLRLRAPAQQRAAVDAFAGSEHAAVLARYRDAFLERAAALAAREAWDRDTAARDAEHAILQVGLSAVDALDPVPGEDVTLKEESDRLGHVEELRAAAHGAHAALTGEDDGPYGVAGARSAGDAVSAVERARRELDQAAHLDPALADWSRRLTEVAYLVGDLSVEIGAYVTDLEADPARLAAVHQRRAALGELVRRYVPAGRGEPTPTVDDLLHWADRARSRVAELSDPLGAGESLERRVDVAEVAVSDLATRVRLGRERAARDLAQAVDAELAGLAMTGASLEVRLNPRPAAGPWGTEDVEILLSAHPGAPARPLSKGASGGELSRVMLAIEVALATAPGATSPPTFVFDEVDAGVGGRAAVEVGRRLADLGRSAQVVVVTHLAQVAAFADRHLVVTKTTRAGEDVITDSGVRPVHGQERVQELARMLSGHADSEAALRHAEELLERAGVGR